jgi:hypothetical protein
MTDFEPTEYYAFRKPAVPHKPGNADLMAYEFMGFLLVRTNPDFILWEVKNLNGSPPPLPLRNLQFNKKSLAEKRISDFLTEEKIKQLLPAVASQSKVMN